MAKLFGEFLIENKLATPEQVLSAVITQLRSQQSTAEVIFDNNLLPTSDQLRILAQQQHAGVDYRTSATTLEIWSPQLAAKVSDLVYRRRRPLGEVLVELGFLTLDTLTQALDKYIESIAANSSPVFSTDDISEATLDLAGTMTFVDHFDRITSPNLRAFLESLEGDAIIKSTSLASILNSCHLEFLALRDGATSIGAIQTQKIANRLTNTFQHIVGLVAHHQTIEIETTVLRDILKLATHVFSSICELLREFTSEAGIANDFNLIDLTLRLTKSQEKLLAQLQMAGRGKLKV